MRCEPDTHERDGETVNRQGATTEPFAEVTLDVLENAARSGYLGHSKFDGLDSPLTRALSFGWWPLRIAWTQIVMRSPWNIRPLLLVRKACNPEAPALFARANLDMHAAGYGEDCLRRAEACLKWLANNVSPASKEYHGVCWGYTHAWQSPGFYQPPGFPNCYISVICAGALLHGYQATGNDLYLDLARRTADFILMDLPVLFEDNNVKCIGYVPKMRTQMQVININALSAALLARLHALTGEDDLLTQARKLMAFVVSQQTDYGAWFYSVDRRYDLVTHDNYHTGMILDSLMEFLAVTESPAAAAALAKGLAFYREHLFLPDGAPKWTNESVLPHDVHGSAQGILTFSLAGDLDTAIRVARWAVKSFYKGHGDFSYQTRKILKKRFTLMHWCNGWMARGMAALALALRRRETEKSTTKT